MGDCGNFNASAGVRFSVKRKEKNTKIEVEDFKSKRKLFIKEELDFDEDAITELFKEGKRIQIEYRDWEELDTINGDTLEEVIGFMEEYDNEDGGYSAYILTEATDELLFIMDLALLEEFEIDEISENFTHEVGIASVSGYIYCYNDNSEYATADTAKTMYLMSLPEAQLTLEADGNGNC